MAAVQAQGQIPDLAVLAVRNFNAVGVEEGVIERAFAEGPETAAPAGRALPDTFETACGWVCQVFPPPAGVSVIGFSSRPDIFTAAGSAAEF